MPLPHVKQTLALRDWGWGGAGLGVRAESLMRPWARIRCGRVSERSRVAFLVKALSR